MDELDGTPIVEVSMGSDYREMMEAMGGQVIPLGRGEGIVPRDVVGIGSASGQSQ